MNKVWLYARQHTTQAELRQQLHSLYQISAAQGLTVVGVSTDSEDAPLRKRPGLKELCWQVRKGQIQTVMVTRLSALSHSNRLLLRLLKQMQRYGVKLQTGHTQLMYELYVRGLETPLRNRAARFGGNLPY